MSESKKIFVPHELKTIEVDVQKRVFRINGEDFGSDCTGFSINCKAGGKDEFFSICMDVENTTKFLSFDRFGKGADKEQNQLEKRIAEMTEKEILRRQLELLAEESKGAHASELVELSHAVAEIGRII